MTTLVAGRRRQLARLLDGLAAQSRLPDRVVVVQMDEDPIALPVTLTGKVVRIAADLTALPLAAARNAGVAALGTDHVVLLDVDCIPLPGFVAGYDAALSAVDGLVCGEVRYLPAGMDSLAALPDLVAAAVPHPARPAPAPGHLERDDLHTLAWTTSLGIRRATFAGLGGFDERFLGYGGEDTDFAERARAAGLGVWWTGDALALHQDHGEGSPRGPQQHLTAIVRNASLFESKHGWWPMRGWLDDFAANGLVEFDPDRGLLRQLR